MDGKFVVGKTAAAMRWFQKFLPPSLRETLSEDGVGSYSRVSGFMVICASLVWVSFLIVRNHVIPDLNGVATFVTAGNSAYAANQVKRVVAASKTGIPNGGPPDPIDPSDPVPNEGGTHDSSR
jgi:hypothetical protein